VDSNDIVIGARMLARLKSRPMPADGSTSTDIARKARRGDRSRFEADQIRKSYQTLEKIVDERQAILEKARAQQERARSAAP